jgi:hypothetical protein
MPYQMVHVKINKASGKITIEAEGFKGTQCDVISEAEAQLGTITNTTDKSERYQHVQPDYVPNRLGG